MPDEKPVIRELRNGRYRVREILGAGGFGVTYLCQDVPNNQLGAIKEYLPEAIAVREAHGLPDYSTERSDEGVSSWKEALF